MKTERRWILGIEGMTCDGCARGLDKALAKVESVLEASTSYPEGRSVVLATAELNRSALAAVVEKKGYALVSAESDDVVADAKDATYDLAIIGSGSAGVAAAIRAAESNARVAIIEAGVLGGTCVNVGCVPSKTLIRAAEARHRAGHVPFAGIETHASGVDFAALVAQKDELVAELRQAKYVDVLAAYPSVSVLRGRARFAPSGDLLVDDVPVRAKKILIATGSSPTVPEIEGLADSRYVTSTELMELPRRPEHLLVLGAGYVALELGQAFARLGSHVTILARSRLLSSDDPDVGDALAEHLRAEGVDVKLGVSVERVEHSDGGLAVRGRDAEGAVEVRGDELLVATGRRPNPAGLGLDELGLELGPKGQLLVDEYLRTSLPGIYAAGDVTGDPSFVYVAAYAGNLAADNAVNEAARTYDVRTVPAVTFTDPAIASVGITEAEARAQGIDAMVSKLPMSYVPRALAARDTRGFIKLVADRSTKLFLGARIVAPEAGELIQPIVMAMKFGIRTDQMAGLLFPYLTAVEGLKLACQTFDKDVAKLSCCAA